MSDAELIAATLAGNSTAFGELVRKHQDRLYHTIAHLVGAGEDAQDIVQEALVQAFVKLESFQGQSQFYTWLYRIAVNLAVTHQRRRKPTTSLERLHEASGQQPHDRAEPPGARLERQETAVQVREALDDLSPEHRAILVLREIDGHDYESIAELLDLPLGTVRSRLHRARLELRAHVRPVGRRPGQERDASPTARTPPGGSARD